ncbi:MAG: group 1 glycosyl transferase [Parcubacteria group bacterium Licking1014_1]|nr:MAG: group 1 glycosyl transferase [Parcubacteria group bacterium Licking1014_1]
MQIKSKKIKICHVASVDITVKFLLLPQLKFLINDGYDVSAVCSGGKWIKDIENQGVKVKTIKITRKITPISDLVSFFRLFLYFRKEKFDIVHVHTPKAGVLGQIAAKLAGVPIIINTIHGLYFNKVSSPFQKIFFIFVKKIAAKCSDLIFSQNREDINTLIEAKIAKSEKIKYLGNGVDIEKFNSKRFSNEFILNKKKELGIDSGFKIIGAVGRLVKEKGYLELFAAFKKVLNKFPQTMLLAIGPEEPEKKDAFPPAIIKDYDIEKNVIFLGERTDVDELYSLMDVFVLPSHREGFPRTVIEAMAMKRPIIATDIRGCQEAIDNGKNGILFSAKDSEKLYNAITFLLENPEKSDNMAEFAREKAEKEFNEELVFFKIKKEYERLLDKKLHCKKNILLDELKICHITTVDITVRFIVLDFLRFLKSQNCKVFIACSFGKWATFLEKEGFSLHNIKMTRRITPISDLVSLIKLFLYFKKEKFDIVHTYTPKAGVLGRIAAKLAGVPAVIHTSYGFYIGVQIPPATRRLIIFAEKIASHFCDLLFSQNMEDIEWAIAKKVVAPKKIKLLTYGIDVARFDPLRFSEDFVLNKKKELGIENKLIIGMIGRFVEEKGYLDLFNAFKIVKNKIPNAVLLLVAPLDKEKEDALDKSILEEYGIENDTILLGYNQELDNIEEIYSLMDIFVLPSYREGLSMSLLEAQAMKKPVIATDIRGCRESVQDSKTGVLVPLKNPGKLAEAIIFFLSNLQKAVITGEAGRKMVLEKFDERIIFDRIKEEYKNLLKKKTK